MAKSKKQTEPKIKEITKDSFGRPTKYKPEYCQALIDYFDIELFQSIGGKQKPNNLPFIQSFCATIGITKPTLHNWIRIYPDFFSAYKKAKAKQKEMLVNLTLSGAWNPAMAIFTAKNILQWSDKQKIEHSGPDGGPIETRSTMDTEALKKALKGG